MHLGGNGDGDAGALLGYLHGAEVVVDLVGSHIDHARGGTSDEHLVADLERIGLDGELRHAQLGVILRALADIHLPLRGIGAVGLVPLAHELADEGGRSQIGGKAIDLCQQLTRLSPIIVGFGQSDTQFVQLICQHWLNLQIL